MALHLPRRRFTVDEYYRMAEAGILGEDDRVELIDGEIVEMAPIGSRHASTVIRLNHLLQTALSGAALVSPQNPVLLGRDAEPEPDLALLRPRADFYADGHPIAGDVLLLIEVADTSVEFDRRVKVPLYAQHGISEVWLVDLTQEAITLYRDPAPDGYRTMHLARRGDTISPVAFPSVAIAVTDVLG